MKDPTVIIAGRKRRGRPPVGVPYTTLSTWLPIETYDKLCQIAQEREQSVSALTRDLIEKRLK